MNAVMDRKPMQLLKDRSNMIPGAGTDELSCSRIFEILQPI